MPFAATAIYPGGIAGVQNLLNQKNKIPSVSAPVLSADVNPGDLSFSVVAGTGDRLPNDNFEASINDEIIFILSRSGDTLTVGTRGAEGTTAAFHASGTSVDAFMTALAHNQLAAEVNAIETGVINSPKSITIHVDGTQLSTLQSSPVTLIPAPDSLHLLKLLGVTISYKRGLYGYGQGGTLYVGALASALGQRFLTSDSNVFTGTAGSVDAVTVGRPDWVSGTNFRYDNNPPDYAGAPFVLTDDNDFTPASIGSSSITPGNAGVGYAVGDTGNIQAGNADASYLIDSVDALASAAIIGVNQGTQTFTVSGDQTSHLPVGGSISVSGSTGNNGTYTIASATFGGVNTDIVVNEVILNPTADGTISAAYGAVLSFSVPYGGASITTPSTGNPTFVSGTQPGLGTGLEIDINSIVAGDGALNITLEYNIIPI